MRRVAPYAVLACMVGSGCSQPVDRTAPVGALSSPVAYGTADTLHTAVVSVLSLVTSTEFQECSGSVVRVAANKGYVLTAAHCCNRYVPTLVVMSNDYSVGEQYLNGGTPAPPVYPVVAGSVYYDALYSADMTLDHDFCMLQFPAPAGTPVLPLPAGNDGLTIGTPIEHVGFGMTDTSTSNTTRRTGTDTVNMQLTSLVMQWSQGGSPGVAGTCEGDSGGPALVPAGSPPAQQVVVGVTSYGPASTCAQAAYGVASRVSSATGPGGFVSSYVAGTPVGVQASALPAASALGGAWAVGGLGAALLVAGLL